MSKVFRQQTYRETVGIYTDNTNISSISHEIKHNLNTPSKFTTIYKPNSIDQNIMLVKCSCLGCVNPKCMKFSIEEFILTDERLSGFPVDADDSVCPLDAIVWERGSHTPTIIANRCINCGICARRCPAGAIYSNGENAVIHIGERNIEFLPKTVENLEKHTAQINELLQCNHVGIFVESSEKSISTLYKKLYAKLNDPQTKYRFSNLIVRNLFLVLGNRCIIRRRGDIYFRIDAILEDTPVIGVVEVEFNKESLESPRAILDDVAVLVSRYEIEKHQIKPFIVSLEFPNIRTEYWRVIKDIRDVLEIQINSLSLGALCILVWQFVDAPISKVDFYADIDSPSIKTAIKKACVGFPIADIINFAVLEPKK